MTRPTQPGPNDYGTVGDPAVSTNTGVQLQPTPTPVQPANTTPAPAANDIQLQDKNYQAAVDTARKELDNSRSSILDIQKQIDDTKNQITALGPNAQYSPGFQTLNNQLTSLYTQQANANTRVATAAESFATVATKAIDSEKLTGVTADKAKADADAANAQAEHSRALADQISKGTPSQIALASAQAASAAAQGRLDDANAGRIAQLAPAELANLQATNNQLKAQVTSLDARAKADAAQAGLTDVQTQLEQAKVATAGRAAEASTRLLELQQQEAENKVQGLPTAEQQQAINQAIVRQQQATGGLTEAQAAAQGATAKATEAGVQQKLLGPTYGLQDQIDQIKKIQQSVFGPGGSGNPADADAMLQQFTTAALGGTTMAQAAENAATAQQNQYQTQMSGINQLQQAQASRANQFASTAGSALGQLSQMNQYAPKGSTAMAGAFRSFMDEMAGRLAQPQFGAVQLPQAPDLPQFMQAFTMGHRAATATAAAATGQQAGGGQPSININFGGDPGFTQGAPRVVPGLDPGFTAGAPAVINRDPGFTPPGYATPPSIQTQPATQANMTGQNPQQTPQQAFTQALSSNTSPLPDFTQRYLTNPMQMLGLMGGQR